MYYRRIIYYRINIQYWRVYPEQRGKTCILIKYLGRPQWCSNDFVMREGG